MLRTTLMRFFIHFVSSLCLVQCSSFLYLAYACQGPNPKLMVSWGLIFPSWYKCADFGSTVLRKRSLSTPHSWGLKTTLCFFGSVAEVEIPGETPIRRAFGYLAAYQLMTTRLATYKENRRTLANMNHALWYSNQNSIESWNFTANYI